MEKKKKNASPRQALCLSSKPSLGLETRHFSPPAYLQKPHWQYGPSTPDPDCQDQALYKMHFSSLFPYKKWVEKEEGVEEEEKLPVFYAIVSW